MAEQLSTYSH